MEVLRITGHRPLNGSVPISGSKNAVLPAMAAALLTDKTLTLHNVPEIEDIGAMVDHLRHLGVDVTATPGRLEITAAAITTTQLGVELTRRLRGSFLLLGPLLARTGEARIARPGGDDIGKRGLEQHVEGLRDMGATIAIEGDQYVARAPTGLSGAHVDLDMPTVTGTENLMMAAALAQGITVISNAAREPHVVDLARCLNGMGLHVSGAGTPIIVIEGAGGLLHGARHSITSDYIEAGTYLIAAAAAGGDVTAEAIVPSDLRPLITKLRMAGCEVEEGTDYIQVARNGPLRPVDVTTWAHPGFATDLQSQYTALMTQADGVSVVSEAIYDNRFRHVPQLAGFGADILVEGRSAIINGPSKLHPAKGTISDIRSGASLVIAAMCATGTSELDGVHHLERGYERFVEKLTALGAQLEIIEGHPS